MSRAASEVLEMLAKERGLPPNRIKPSQRLLQALGIDGDPPKRWITAHIFLFARLVRPATESSSHSTLDSLRPVSQYRSLGQIHFPTPLICEWFCGSLKNVRKDKAGYEK